MPANSSSIQWTSGNKLVLLFDYCLLPWYVHFNGIVTRILFVCQISDAYEKSDRLEFVDISQSVIFLRSKAFLRRLFFSSYFVRNIRYISLDSVDIFIRYLSDEQSDFRFKVLDKLDQEVMSVYCPSPNIVTCCGATWHWCDRCRLHAVVYSPPGVVAGFIRRQCVSASLLR